MTAHWWWVHHQARSAQAIRELIGLSVDQSFGDGLPLTNRTVCVGVVVAGDSSGRRRLSQVLQVLARYVKAPKVIGQEADGEQRDDDERRERDHLGRLPLAQVGTHGVGGVPG
jgi:hypothetical protein